MLIARGERFRREVARPRVGREDRRGDRDAGYEPVPAGDLEKARALEDFLGPFGAFGPSFYRFWKP